MEEKEVLVGMKEEVKKWEALMEARNEEEVVKRVKGVKEVVEVVEVFLKMRAPDSVNKDTNNFQQGSLPTIQRVIHAKLDDTA